MVEIGSIWECSCGHSEFNELQPEECLECGELNSFVQMPQELVEEREKEMLEEKSLSVSKKSPKSKVKKTKGVKKK